MNKFWFGLSSYRWVCIAWLLIILFSAPLVSAVESMEVPLSLQFKMLVKASTYNRQQKSKDPKVLRVGIVHSNLAESEKIAKKMIKGFQKTPPLRVRNYELMLEPIPFENAEQFEKETSSRAIHIYYIAPGNETHLEEILETGKKMGLLTTTGVVDYVYEGVNLGVRNDGARPKFLYNPKTADANGIDFDSNFLRLVQLVR